MFEIMVYVSFKDGAAGLQSDEKFEYFRSISEYKARG
jgi:hypothetical protein